MRVFCIIRLIRPMHLQTPPSPLFPPFYYISQGVGIPTGGWYAFLASYAVTMLDGVRFLYVEDVEGVY